MFAFALVFSCIIVLSGGVVLEFAFCADTEASAQGRAIAAIKTKKRMRRLVVYLFTVLLLLLLHVARPLCDEKAGAPEF